MDEHEKEAYQKFVGNGNRLSLKVQESFGSLKNECKIESNIFLVRGDDFIGIVDTDISQCRVSN